MRKVKVIQNDTKDCGVACILSVIKYYGGNNTMENLREMTNITKNGCTALDIVNTLKYSGFDAIGYKSEIENLTNIKLPAIVHFNYQNQYYHFVVLYHINHKYAEIMDPAQGFVKMKLSDFSNKYDGVIILLNPISQIINIQNDQDINQTLKKELYNNKYIIMRIIYISILITVLSIILGYYLKLTINSINQENTIFNIKNITILFFILTILKCVYDYVKTNLEIYLNKILNYKITLSFIDHLFRIPLYSFKSRTIGEIASRVYDLDNVREMITQLYINIIIDGILSVFTIIFLGFISLKLTIVVLCIVIGYFINSLFLKKNIKHRIEKSINSETEYNKYLIESLSGITSIKSSNQIDYFLNNVNNLVIDNINERNKLDKYINVDKLIKNLINDLGFLIINIVGINLIMKGKLSIIDLITFNSISVYILNSIKNIANMIPKFALIKSSFNRINDFINIKEEEINEGIKLINGKITLKKLGYSYDGNNYIFKDKSMIIDDNDKVWLKGRSGIGKSTICRIINGLINNYEGDILINDVNLKEYCLKDIRNNICYISQDETIFHDSIKNNILLGREVSLEKFNQICKICLLDSIVGDKPFRYETIVGEDGFNLSGGEKQRIIVARMILNRNKIIIFDEALSEVNSSMENSIMQNILKVFNNHTIIYVSHRYNSIFKKVIDIEKI